MHWSYYWLHIELEESDRQIVYHFVFSGFFFYTHYTYTKSVVPNFLIMMFLNVDILHLQSGIAGLIGKNKT